MGGNWTLKLKAFHIWIFWQFLSCSDVGGDLRSPDMHRFLLSSPFSLHYSVPTISRNSSTSLSLSLPYRHRILINYKGNWIKIKLLIFFFSLYILFSTISKLQSTFLKRRKKETKEVKERKTKKASMAFSSIPIHLDPSNWNQVCISRRIYKFPPIFCSFLRHLLFTLFQFFLLSSLQNIKKITNLREQFTKGEFSMFFAMTIFRSVAYNMVKSFWSLTFYFLKQISQSISMFETSNKAIDQ